MELPEPDRRVTPEVQILPNFATASLIERNFSMNGILECSVLSRFCAFPLGEHPRRQRAEAVLRLNPIIGRAQASVCRDFEVDRALAGLSAGMALDLHDRSSPPTTQLYTPIAAHPPVASPRGRNSRIVQFMAIIAVGGRKGGIGKSTIVGNLAGGIRQDGAARRGARCGSPAQPRGLGATG